MGDCLLDGLTLVLCVCHLSIGQGSVSIALGNLGITQIARVTHKLEWLPI